jgi:hypothetical protein
MDAVGVPQQRRRPLVCPGVVVDIGAGTGRDAAWLASLGHDFLTIEPFAAVRSQGGRLHPDPRIRWLDDRLPSLSATTRLGVAADTAERRLDACATGR